MSLAARLVLFLIAGAMASVLIVLAILDLPGFGSTHHPYRDAAIAPAVEHATSNVVSSVNFDLRGLDTLGEESILLASVVGVAVLLRPADDEEEGSPNLSPGRLLDLVGLAGYALLAVTVVIGLDVIAHGHLTPGGGFQGGVVLGTGLHLAYVAGRYPTLRKLSPGHSFEWAEALAAGAFACVGLSALLVSGAFLENVLPHGELGTLFSSGTVELLNGAVGVEVASSTMVLLSKFLEQAILVHREHDDEGGRGGRRGRAGGADGGAAGDEGGGGGAGGGTGRGGKGRR